jgi:prepilin-type N-terminal cleavage/methylation domain-containing protein
MKQMLKRPTSLRVRQSGFTIVELMIATVVSSTILLVITIGVIHFTNGYYHGITSSNTQATTQNAIDAIAHAIEFNSSGTVATDGSQGVFCAGNQVFLYTLGKQLTGDPSPANWGLYQLDNPSSNCVVPPDTSGGQELLGSKMRLSYLSLQEVGSADVWNLGVRVAYGDSDLLCDKSVGGATGGCSPGAADFTATSTISGDDIFCKTVTGSQFCSVTALNTAIGQRIAN